MPKFLSACVIFLTLAVVSAAFGLQKPDQQPTKPAQPASAEKKTPPKIETPTARLTSAKNVFITRSHGGKIAYDTIRTTIDDWQRFTLVNSADKADVIIEVASSGGDNGVRVGSSMSPNPETGRMEESTHSTRDLSATEVSMTVLDAHNKRVLWQGTESAKYAVREKARENNLVEAAEKLASKFHDRLEPRGRQ
jgi:hypothetical protein